MPIQEDLTYERTATGALGGDVSVELSRRQLTLLRLIDGVTPMSTFQQHLQNYDIPVIFEELAELGLIEPVNRDKKNVPLRKDPGIPSRHWKSIVAAMLPSLFSGEGSVQQLHLDRTESALKDLEEFSEDMEEDFEEAQDVANNAQNAASSNVPNNEDKEEAPSLVPTKAEDKQADATLSLLNKYAPGLSDEMTDAFRNQDKEGDF